MRGGGLKGRQASVVVIGAGQAGLSAAYHLKRLGFADAVGSPAGAAVTPSADAETFVVLDAERQPGGAWQHRWPSLTMATVNGIFDLPKFPQPAPDPAEPSRDAVPRYFAAYEREYALPILRPWEVRAVSRADQDPHGWLNIEGGAPLKGTGERCAPASGSAIRSETGPIGPISNGFPPPEGALGTWRARAIINATGTWTNPIWPHYPGQASFAGRQLHTRDYVSAAPFAGRRVAIVGGGISAIQQLEEISRVAETFWYTRRPPVFSDGPFEPETTGRATIAKVMADVEAGRPTGSVVSYTGLFWTPYARAAQARGVLKRRPMFTAIERNGVREADANFTPVDAILWATGFKPALDHLDPLQLRNAAGGISVHGTQVDADPRVHLIGFGPSQSTVGANRAGRQAAAAIARWLRAAAD